VASRRQVGRVRVDAAATSLVFLADGQRLAVGDARAGVSIWDTASGKLLVRYAGHGKLVPGIALSPDGKTLATASHDGTVKLWAVK
jgi:WD40 repeat protein